LEERKQEKEKKKKRKTWLPVGELIVVPIPAHARTSLAVMCNKKTF
jgi:hypothetical protein